MKLWAAMALRITFATYIVYASQTATFAKIGRSKSHPKWVFPVFLSQQILEGKKKAMFLQKTQALRMEKVQVLPAQPMRRPGHKRRPRLYVKAVKPVGGLPGGGEFFLMWSLGDFFVPPWGGVPAVCFHSCWWCLGLDRWPLQVVLWKQQFCCADRCGSFRLWNFTVVFSRSGTDVLFWQQERIGGLGKKVIVSKYRQPNV